MDCSTKADCWKSRRRKSRTGHVRRAQVADYIRERDRHNERDGDSDEPNWEEWLQDNRVELNAMTSPQRVAWVERKFAAYNVAKVIPPEDIARDLLVGHIKGAIAEQVEEEALRSKEQWIAEQIAARFAKVKIPTDITMRIANYLERYRSSRWKDAIGELSLIIRMTTA